MQGFWRKFASFCKVFSANLPVFAKIRFCDIKILDLEPWWESTLAIKPIVAQRILYDIRDDNSYRVRKLADGNCWMTSNLALGSTEQTYTLTSADTNLPDGETFTLPIASAFGTNDWSAGTIDSPNAVVKVNHNDDYPEYGNLYNWYTAVAGQMVRGNNKQTPYSICPNNWSLPVNYAGVSPNYVPNVYNLLINEYGFTVGWPAIISVDEYNRLFEAPFDYVKSGLIRNNELIEVHESMGLWTKRTSNTNETDKMVYYTYVLHTGGAYMLNTAGLAQVYGGQGVRCAMEV